jgi:hypothetical protein
MPNVEAVRWYRGREGRSTTIASSLSMVLAVGASIKLGIQDPATRPLFLTVAVLECCAWFSFAVLMWRAGIAVTAEHIVVRKAAGRQQLIPWPSVAGFDLGRPKYWFSDAVIYVVRDDGRRVCTRGCSFHRWSNKRTRASARRMLWELEMERRSHGNPIRL